MNISPSKESGGDETQSYVYWAVVVMREAEAWMQKFTRVLELCKRTKSKCETCPTSGMCVYFQEGWAKAL